MYSLWFYLIYRLLLLATLTDTNAITTPIIPDHFLEHRTCPLHKVNQFLSKFLILITSSQSSTHSLLSPKTRCIFATDTDASNITGRVGIQKYTPLKEAVWGKKPHTLNKSTILKNYLYWPNLQLVWWLHSVYISSWFMIQLHILPDNSQLAVMSYSWNNSLCLWLYPVYVLWECLNIRTPKRKNI